MVRNLTFLAAPLVWLLTATTLLGNADPLSVVPDDALGMVVANDLSDLSARVQKLTQKMQLPVPELLPMAQIFLGAQQGLDEKGGLAAAAFPDSDADFGVAIAVFVPVTDYKAFVAQLQPEDAEAAITAVTVMGQKFLVAKKQDFAVFVPEEQKITLERIVAATKSADGLLAPLRPWLKEQQIALVLTPAGKKLLFEKLDGLLKTGSEALEQVQKQAAGDKEEDEDDNDEEADDAADAPSEDAEADDEKDNQADAAAQLRTAQEMLEGVREWLGSSAPELAQLGVGIRIDDKTALHLSMRVAFTPGGALAKMGQSVVVPQRGLLAGLPAGKFVITYGGSSVQGGSALAKLVDGMGSMGLKQMGVGEEQTKKYFAVMARMRANQLNTCGLMGQLRPGDSILSSALSVDFVKNAPEQVNLSRELFEILKSGDPKKSKLPTYEIKDIMIGDLKALEVSTDMNAMFAAAGGDPTGAQQVVQSFFGKIFGEGGVMRAYMAAADEHTVAAAYTKEQLVRAVAHLRSRGTGLEKDPQIANTTLLLPKGSQWAAYVNPRGLLELIDTVLRQVLPEGMNFRIPPFPETDPIGLGAHIDEAGLDAELVLPDSVVAGIGQYVTHVQQMFQQQAAPLP